MIFDKGSIPIIAQFFFFGLLLGWGPCLASCAPALVCYSAVSPGGWVASAKKYFYFSAGRITVYCVFAFAVFRFGQGVISNLPQPVVRSLGIAGGGAVIVLGCAYLFKSFALSPASSCARLAFFGRAGKTHAAVLGAALAFLPCAPLIAVLSYAGASSSNLFSALALVAVFGIGTVISPLFVLVLLSRYSHKLIAGIPPVYARVFNCILSGALVFLGGRIILGVL